MYENRHARFTAVDPLLASGKSANPQTFNRYIYVMNNPLVLTDPSGLQAGSDISFINPTGNWYMHREGGVPQYIKNGDPVSPFYDPITETNRWSYGTPVYRAVGMDDYHVIRLHPNGPREPGSVLDNRTGKRVQDRLSDFERYGWEVIWSDKMIEPNPGVRNAIEPYDIALALMPFKFSAGSGSFGRFVTRSEGSYYAKEVLPGGKGNVIAGHAEYVYGSGEVVIPKGTSLTTVKDGIKILDETGQLMEQGNWAELGRQLQTGSRIGRDVTGMTTHLPGSTVRNYLVRPPNRLTVFSNSTTVNRSTFLDQLLKENQGNCILATCTK